jgi:hypothetical protein
MKFNVVFLLKVPILNIDLRYIPVIMAILGPIISITQNLFIISKGGVGKNCSSVAVRTFFFLFFCLK